MACFWNNNQSQIFMVVVSAILLKYFCDDSHVGLRVWLGVCSFDYLLQRGRYKREMNVGTLPAEIKMLFCLPVDIAIPIMKSSTCYIYSQTCIKRSPLGQRNSGLIRQVTSLKRFNSYEICYNRKRKKWPFNTGDCLIVVIDRFDCILHVAFLFLYFR